MGKGELTRNAILDKAMTVASRKGLGGLTIGLLAEELQLSKSGLFAHFKSKETLQIHLLEHVAERFIDRVIRPSISEARGAERLIAIFDRWLEWTRWNALPGGCIFVAASTELDDRPGPVRDRLVELQLQWLGALERAARVAVEAGDLAGDLDCEQFAHELHGIMLMYHHARRLLRDSKAEGRARLSFESLMARSRAVAKRSRTLAPASKGVAR